MNEFQSQRKHDTHDFGVVCLNCKRKGHDRDASYCKQCGQAL
jgi:rRNA maturation endonuclease Nob1